MIMVIVFITTDEINMVMVIMFAVMNFIMDNGNGNDNDVYEKHGTCSYS